MCHVAAGEVNVQEPLECKVPLVDAGKHEEHGNGQYKPWRQNSHIPWKAAMLPMTRSLRGALFRQTSDVPSTTCIDRCVNEAAMP
jgi:hypothetical protein